MEEKLNEAFWQQLLYALAGELDYGVHVVMKNHTTLLYNQAMAQLEGQSAEEVLNQDFRQIFSEIPREESTLLRALDHGEPTYHREQRYLNRYGKWIHTINTTLPVLDEEGHVMAAVEFSKDLTPMKEMSDRILAMERGPEDSKAPKEIPRDHIKTYTFEDLVGDDSAFRETMDIAKRACGSNASVFLYGETGTGKELVAQSIHYGSNRKSKPFLAQNCAALPESLLEGILFGTTKGGFTGAVDREGLFEQANGGTLLLDEISAMPYALQGKLLRVLQEDYIRRVGGTRDIPIDARIIATVNEEPEQLIREGRLRKDLYYRLNIVHLELPPLRQRKSDIPLLVEHFLEKHNHRFHKEVWMVAERAMERLMDYHYPGNVRELENILMSAISLVDKEHVLTEKLIRIPREEGETARQVGVNPEELGKPLEKYLENQERELVEEALHRTGGNVSQAARMLGIKRQTLQHKMKKYGWKGDRVDASTEGNR
jgi:arginine utilization regulatory protein